MIEHLKSALNVLRVVRELTAVIGVAVSFGKDSLATLDLCRQLFGRVEGYYLFRVRGLGTVRKWADEVRQRTGVSVRMYPHFDLARCYKYAVMRPHLPQGVKVPMIKMRDIDTFFRQDAKVEWIAYGWRRSDSLSRAIIMKKCGGVDFRARRVFPLRAWTRAEVYKYLAEVGIPQPDTLGRKEQGGLDFHPGALEYLRRIAPDDYERWSRDFPFSGVQSIS